MRDRREVLRDGVVILAASALGGMACGTGDEACATAWKMSPTYEPKSEPGKLFGIVVQTGPSFEINSNRWAAEVGFRAGRDAWKHNGPIRTGDARKGIVVPLGAQPIQVRVRSIYTYPIGERPTACTEPPIAEFLGPLLISPGAYFQPTFR